MLMLKSLFLAEVSLRGTGLETMCSAKARMRYFLEAQFTREFGVARKPSYHASALHSGP